MLALRFSTCLLIGLTAAGPLGSAALARDDASVPAFVSDVAPILAKYCTGCHNPDDREGDLSLTTFEQIFQGLDDGPLLLPGQPESSRLMRVITGQAELAMPPEFYEAPTPEEIAVLSAWITAGAKGPEGDPQTPRLIVPEVATKVEAAAAPITALAFSPDGSRIALGRYGRVELRDVAGKQLLLSLEDIAGKVNALHFTRDDQQLVVATGVTGLYGRVEIYDAASGNLQRVLTGHTDIINDAEISPDGTLLATASYDKLVTIWDLASGEKVRELAGHNGAVFDVAFSPKGDVLASASADETVKLWNAATGERLDTLGQGEAEQYAVAFSPRGDFVAAGGADNRIRIWQFISRQQPATNPLLYTRFAHGGAVTALEFANAGDVLITAGDDRFVKFWECERFAEMSLLGPRPTLINDLATSRTGNCFAVAQLDGTWETLPVGAPTSRPQGGRKEGSSKSTPREGPVGQLAEIAEQEPNDAFTDATPLAIPGTATGVIKSTRQGQEEDRDIFRFQAKAGEQWVLEVKAARDGSPLDSKIEVRTEKGERIERVVLQAVRDSYLKYRGQNSDELSDFRLHNWEEMDVDEYVYMNGDVMRLWFYPRGVDSGYMMYPGQQKRYAYFGTTAITHALNEPAYTVAPSPPGASLPPSGLPRFTIYYENDDDGQRALGVDSRLTFTAPAAGNYSAVVTDVRGFGGQGYCYELTVRPPRPDFDVVLEIDSPTIDAGSGREFKATLDRHDGFQGEVTVDIQGLPPGFVASTPLVIEREQIHAYGVINVLPDANPPTAEQTKQTQVVASAEVRGEQRRKQVPGLKKLSVSDAPKVRVTVLSPKEAERTSAEVGFVRSAGERVELTIAPGDTISAVACIERNAGFEGEVLLGKDLAGRNLPHGVYVDNIGLNGLLILSGENRRKFFITAATWAPETTRRFHLRAEVEGGNQASWPVILHVRSPQDQRQARLDATSKTAP